MTFSMPSETKFYRLVFHAGTSAVGRAPYAQLPPEDIALLDADPALRSRYCELALTVILPALRRMSKILGTTFHLHQSTYISASPRDAWTRSCRGSGVTRRPASAYRLSCSTRCVCTWHSMVEC